MVSVHAATGPGATPANARIGPCRRLSLRPSPRCASTAWRMPHSFVCAGSDDASMSADGQNQAPGVSSIENGIIVSGFASETPMSSQRAPL